MFSVQFSKKTYSLIYLSDREILHLLVYCPKVHNNRAGPHRSRRQELHPDLPRGCHGPACITFPGTLTGS